MNLPKLLKVDMKAKLNHVNESIKHFHMPSAQEVKKGYMNSGFHKQFSQPLAVRTRLEEGQVQVQREMMTKRKTPSQLSQMNHPLDIPLPKFKLPTMSKEETEASNTLENADKSRLYNTLPRSWRQQNIVTSTRTMEDQEEATLRQNLVKSKSPAQLAEFNTISDFPLPSKVKNLLSPSERKINAQRQRKLSASSSRWKFGSIFNGGGGGDLKRAQSESAFTKSEEPLSLTAPQHNWKGQKLITNVKVEAAGTEEIEKRRALATSKSPAELAQIKSLAEIPIPSTLKRMTHFKRENDRKGGVLIKSNSCSDMDRRGKEKWSASIKKSLNAQCIVRSKIENPEVQAERAQLLKNKTVTELSKFRNLNDFPLASTLQQLVEPGGSRVGGKDKLPTLGLASQPPKSMQDYIPEGLKSTLLVATKTGQDQEVLKDRQELVRCKTPSELGQMKGMGDFPMPTLSRSRPTSPMSEPGTS